MSNVYNYQNFIKCFQYKKTIIKTRCFFSTHSKKGWKLLEQRSNIILFDRLFINAGESFTMVDSTVFIVHLKKLSYYI